VTEISFVGDFRLLQIQKITRKPCCRKETARCRKCSFPLKFANNFHYKYKIAKLRKRLYA